MAGIPVMGSPEPLSVLGESIRRGLFVEEGSRRQWKGCSKESREKEKQEKMAQRFMTLQSPLPGVVGSWVSWSPCLAPCMWTMATMIALLDYLKSVWTLWGREYWSHAQV